MVVARSAPEPGLVEAAGDHRRFAKLVEPMRRELHLFCYRMLGSFDDAEDVLQEAQLKAWRSFGSFDGRASFRTWMFRVAANATIDALRSRRRRLLPQDVTPGRDAVQGLGDRREDLPWIQPYPDALLPDADPHAALELRESVSLAFVRALQILPPQQRAALILHDVIGWSGAEIARALGTSVAAVNSALQRARATASSVNASARSASDAQRAELASRYVRAWENGDLEAIVEMLTTDAVHAMPPWPAWFAGRETLRALYASYEIWRGHPGRGLFRVLPTRLNGELAFAEYCREAREGPYRALAFTIAFLDESGTRLREKVSFVTPDLFRAFGFPLSLPAERARSEEGIEMAILRARFREHAEVDKTR